ncbi:MAG: hypothetical protein JWN48_1553 [Myxococcaceae bacterium]|nr:hypothetical protein [Myxococcaceae bacterium]
MSERGEVLARFEVSSSDQRGLAYLRGICALLALVGAGLMLLGKLPVPLFMVALLAVLLSVAWLAQARRLSRAARDPKRPALIAHAGGLALEEAGRNDWLSWSDVVRIEVDEERLDIVITKRDAATLRIEPRYQGVDLYDLVRTLDGIWRSALAPSVQSDRGGST